MEYWLFSSNGKDIIKEVSLDYWQNISDILIF